MKNKLIKSLLVVSVFALVGCNKGEPTHADENFVEVTFNAGEGTFKESGLQTRMLRIRKGLKWKDIKPIAPTKNDISSPGKSLSYWKIKGADKPIDDNDAFNKNTQLDGVFVKITTIKVTFQCDANKYSYFGNDEEHPIESKTLTMDINTTYGEIKNQVKPNIKSTAPTGTLFLYYDDSDGTHTFDDYVFTKDQTITAICKEEEKPSSFANDNWSLFGYIVSEKGLNHIKTNNHDNYGYSEEYIANGNTFVGLTRDLTVAGKNYKVRVIGEGVDSITEDGSSKAALTFEFVDALEDSVAFDIEEKDKTTWSSSSLRSYFDSLYERDVDSSIKGYLKNVYKASQTRDGKEVSLVYDNFFALSATEYGIVKGSEEGQRSDIDVEGLYTATGWDGVYPYYKDVPSTKREKVFKGAITHNCSYYTRSVDNESSSGYAWYINSSGELNETSSSVYIGRGIAPAFCIGGKI